MKIVNDTGVFVSMLEEKDPYLNYVKTLNDTNTINYYNEAMVIFWCPKENEEVQYFNSISKEDLYAIEDDMSYYMTEAQSFIFEQQDIGQIDFQLKNDINDCCGFIVRGDTVKICKAMCPDYHIWCVILFEPSQHPKIVSTVMMEDSFNQYFYK
jgi:hypothetical protein